MVSLQCEKWDESQGCSKCKSCLVNGYHHTAWRLQTISYFNIPGFKRILKYFCCRCYHFCCCLLHLWMGCVLDNNYLETHIDHSFLLLPSGTTTNCIPVIVQLECFTTVCKVFFYQRVDMWPFNSLITYQNIYYNLMRQYNMKYISIHKIRWEISILV